jgi:hypothetical protein
MKSLRWWFAASLIVACTNGPSLQAPAQPVVEGPRMDAQGPVGGMAPEDLGTAGCGGGCQPAHDAGVPVTAPRDAGVPPNMPDSSTGPRTVEDDTDAGGSIAADSGAPPSDRPSGVALCYGAGEHAAAQQHWRALHSGDLAGRGDVIAQLKAAAAAEPRSEEFALLLGLTSLWRVAEPYAPESLDPLLTLDSIETAQRELERAYALCPTDHRIPAWLGPIKIRMGRMLDDAKLVADGFAVLEQGIRHYPGFVLFAKFLVHADLPASDPEFLKAVEAVRENAKYCGTPATGLSTDPACSNHPHASHNIEGSAVFLGDMYAKAQDRAAALAAYSSAKLVPTWNSWDYRDLLEERIRTLDARMAAAASPSTFDDREAAWESQIQCSLCHRE